MKKQFLFLIVLIFMVSCCTAQKAPEKKNGGHEDKKIEMTEPPIMEDPGIGGDVHREERPEMEAPDDGLCYSESEPVCGGNPIEAPSAPIPTVVPELPYPAMAREETAEMAARGNEREIFTESEAINIAKGDIGTVKYNVPEEMDLNETQVLHLLIGLDSILREAFPEGPGEVIESNLEISNRMRADLRAINPEAIIIKRHREKPDRLLVEGSAEWFWDITAKEDGPQKIELKVFRLIKLDDVEDWKRIQTYKDTIIINSSFWEKLKELFYEWQWFAILISGIATVIGWFKFKKDRKVKNGRK